MRTASLLATLSLAVLPTAQAQNPMARPQAPAAYLLDGVWNGVNLERRSNCTNAQNNGSRGTYAQFTVGFNTQGRFAISQAGITGLNCEYTGTHTMAGLGLQLEGSYTCTDGKRGTFESLGVLASSTLLHIRFATQLTGSESCDIDAVLSLARAAPP